MTYSSCNPASNTILNKIPYASDEEFDALLIRAKEAQKKWKKTDSEMRAQLATKLANLTREKQSQLATLSTLEMGKVKREALTEIEKCALCCDYYSVHAAPFLADEPFYTNAGKSYVSYDPLGTILSVMPWNFPFWQVYRFAIPAILAGNAVILKHAGNVPQVAKAIEALFLEAGFPEGVFTNVFADKKQIEKAIAGPHIQAVTLTGSANAGRSIAAMAGANLKKCVLELGGSDPFIVLKDADLELAVTRAVVSRFQNCGQSCVSSKRFILVPEIADEFIALFKEKISALKMGDPTLDTTQIGPMARADLRDQLHEQVKVSIQKGAKVLLGCTSVDGKGNYYLPSLLDNVKPGMPAYEEEMFGPVASILRAKDEEDAIRLANDTVYGLGASIWSKDFEWAEELAKQIEAGMTYINGIVKSDPRLPFGGIKASGFGRELSYHGVREFVNAKTVWIKDRPEHLGEERRQADRRQVDRRN